MKITCVLLLTLASTQAHTTCMNNSIGDTQIGADSQIGVVKGPAGSKSHQQLSMFNMTLEMWTHVIARGSDRAGIDGRHTVCIPNFRKHNLDPVRFNETCLAATNTQKRRSHDCANLSTAAYTPTETSGIETLGAVEDLVAGFTRSVGDLQNLAVSLFPRVATMLFFRCGASSVTSLSWLMSCMPAVFLAMSTWPTVAGQVSQGLLDSLCYDPQYDCWSDPSQSMDDCMNNPPGPQVPCRDLNCALPSDDPLAYMDPNFEYEWAPCLDVACSGPSGNGPPDPNLWLYGDCASRLQGSYDLMMMMISAASCRELVFEEGICGTHCDVCGAPWQKSNTGYDECNNWRLTAYEDGWGDATMSIRNVRDGILQIDGYVYGVESSWYISPGVANVCLHPSRCYEITVDGPPTTRWSIHDAFGVLVIEGSGPFSREVCHCDHYGGDACFDCAVVAPGGGTLGDCNDAVPTAMVRDSMARNNTEASTDSSSTIAHGHACLMACDEEAHMRPVSCFNGTIRTPTACCAAGTEWRSESDLTCEPCTLGHSDSDNNPWTLCEECPAGTYSGQASATECIACPPGTFSPSGASECTECAAGKIDSDADASTPCDECPLGTYSGQVGATAGCIACPPGTFSYFGSSECTECAAGTIAVPTGVRCQSCPPATYSDSRGVECIACQNGTFATYSSSECTECAAGKIDSDADASTPCEECPPGTYSEVGSTAGCIACPPGTFSHFGSSECVPSCKVYLETLREDTVLRLDTLAHPRSTPDVTKCSMEGASMRAGLSFAQICDIYQFAHQVQIAYDTPVSLERMMNISLCADYYCREGGDGFDNPPCSAECNTSPTGWNGRLEGRCNQTSTEWYGLNGPVDASSVCAELTRDAAMYDRYEMYNPDTDGLTAQVRQVIERDLMSMSANPLNPMVVEAGDELTDVACSYVNASLPVSLDMAGNLQREAVPAVPVHPCEIQGIPCDMLIYGPTSPDCDPSRPSFCDDGSHVSESCSECTGGANAADGTDGTDGCTNGGRGCDSIGSGAWGADARTVCDVASSYLCDEGGQPNEKCDICYRYPRATETRWDSPGLQVSGSEASLNISDSILAMNPAGAIYVDIGASANVQGTCFLQNQLLPKEVSLPSFTTLGRLFGTVWESPQHAACDPLCYSDQCPDRDDFACSAATYGAGLFVRQAARATIANSTFIRNSATYGGAIFVGQGARVNIAGSSFRYNGLSPYQMTSVNNEFVDQYGSPMAQVEGRGGTIFVATAAQVTIAHSSVTDTQSGVAIEVDKQAHAFVEGTVFAKNREGGISVGENAHLTVERSTFSMSSEEEVGNQGMGGMEEVGNQGMGGSADIYIGARAQATILHTAFTSVSCLGVDTVVSALSAEYMRIVQSPSCSSVCERTRIDEIGPQLQWYLDMMTVTDPEQFMGVPTAWVEAASSLTSGTKTALDVDESALLFVQGSSFECITGNAIDLGAESFLTVRDTTFTHITNGAIRISVGSQATIEDSNFVSNEAFAGAAVYSRGTVRIEGCTFTNSHGSAIDAAGDVTIADSSFTDNFYRSGSSSLDGFHITTSPPLREFKVMNTTFDPVHDSTKNQGVKYATCGWDCERYSCSAGDQCSYSNFSLHCDDCAQSLIGDGKRCMSCIPGKSPNEEQTSCVDCIGLSHSPFGLMCQQCPVGNIPNTDKTACVDATQTDANDLSIVAQVLNSSNFIPVTTLSASVPNVEAVLEDGSITQTTFVHMVGEQMSLALEVDASSIAITNVRQALNEADHGGRRRTQTMGEVTFDLQVVATGTDATTAVTLLSDQLADPDSILRTTGGMTTEVPMFSFTCPLGMYRSIGGGDCRYCGSTSVPDSSNNFQSCKECMPGQVPDSTRSRCICGDGYYNSSEGSNPLKCYVDGEPWSTVTAATTTDCLPCIETGCIDLGAVSCRGGSVTLNPGYSVSLTSLQQGVSLNDMVGQRRVYACTVPGACVGDELQCSVAYAGPLCDYCAAGYSRPGFTGECTECSKSLSIAWAALGAMGAVVAVTLTMYWVASADDSKVGRITVMLTLGKIAVSLVQVLTQLEFSLQIIWPASFRWFIDLLKVFSMDLLGFVNVGCLSQYTYTGKFVFAILLAPVMLLAVGVVYKLRVNVEGIVNRCVKMGLLTLFLIYPFVSQTVFQGFSCRKLDEAEEWLEVDYQISCLSDSYLAFVSLGVVGVIVYPVGIPTVTLLQLWRNSHEIKNGGAGRKRYDFLVSDYKPQFYYWDCLEMLRKAFITGILMFFKKGSLFQLVIAMTFCVAFLSSVAWLRPFASRTANVFKVATEVALLVSLILIVLLKIDLSKEDVPGGEAFVGFLLLLSNTVIPASSLVLAFLAFGFDLGEDGKDGPEILQNKKEGKLTKKEQQMDNPIADDSEDE